jgi:hypothetical protein
MQSAGAASGGVVAAIGGSMAGRLAAVDDAVPRCQRSWEQPASIPASTTAIQALRTTAMTESVPSGSQ